MGWVAITTDVLGVEPSVPTSIHNLKSDDAPMPDIQVEGRRIVADDSSRIGIYSLSGMKVNVNEVLNPGVYVVRSGNKSVKVLIK